MKRTSGIFLVVGAVLALAASVQAQAGEQPRLPDTAKKVKNSLLSKAQMLQYKGEHDKAIALYRMAAAQAPADLGTTLLLSGALLQLDRVGQAREAWDKWMKHSKRSDRLKIAAEHLMVRLMRDGKAPRAEAVCDAWLLKLEAWDRFSVLGDIYWQAGDRIRAVQLYCRQLAAGPCNTSVARRVAAWSLAAGGPRAATAALRLYLRHTPSDLVVTRQLVDMLVQQKRAKEVAAAWKRWLGATRMRNGHATVGAYYRKAGQQDLAVSQYRLHLKKDPSDMDSVRYLASVLRRAGKKDEVVKLYVAAVKDNPHVRVVREAARELMAMGRKKEAEQAWLRWYGRSIGNSQRDLEMARLYLRWGKKDQAVAHLRKHVAARPRDAEGVRLLAGLLLARKEGKAARAMLETFVKKSTMRGRRSMVAYVYMRAGDARAAKKHYLQHMRKTGHNRYELRTFARELTAKNHWRAAADLWADYCKRSKSSSRHEHAGDFFRSVNRRREAVAHYTKHLTIEPEDTWVIRMLAQQHVKAGRRAAANKVWQRYLTSSSDSGRFERAARYYERSGQRARAVALFKRHLQLNPRNLRAHRMMASALVAAGKDKEAVALWQGAVQNLSDRNRFKEAGDFFRSQGKMSRAVAMYRQHVQLNPGSSGAYRALARALRTVGKVNEAVALWDKAVKTSTDKRRFEAAGDFFKSVQRWSEAVAMYRKHLELHPKERSAYGSLAKALHHLGKTDQAVTLWEKAVKTLPDRYRFERAGDFFRSVGRRDRALVMYRKHYDLRPNRWSCRTLTRALREADKEDEAVAVWDKAVKTLTDRSRYDAAGSFMRDIGKSKRAVVMYRKHLELNPKSISAYNTLARALADAGKEDEAVALWDGAVRTLSGTNRLQRAADFFNSIGRTSRAISLYRRYVKASPTNVWARRSLAMALRRAGKTTEAIALWKRAMRDLPTDSCFRNAADFFQGMGRVEMALKAQRKRLKLNPGDVGASGAIANLLWQSGKGKQAVALWEKVVRKSSGRDRFRRAGHFFRGIGRWDRAVAMYRKHLARRPDDQSTSGYLGRALVRMGKTAEAVAMWDKIVRSGANTHRHESAGRFFSHIGQHGRAVTLYRKYLALNPTNPSAHRELARALRRTGKIKEAVALWDKATRTLTDRYRYNRAAQFFKRIGRWDRAVALYREDLKLSPNNSSTIRALAQVLVSAGKFAEAEALWGKAVKRASDRYRYNNAAYFYAGIGRPGRALAMYRKHLALNPSNRWAIDGLANQLVRAGQAAEAVKVWDAGLKTCHAANRFASAGRMHHRLGNFDRAIKLVQKNLRLAPADVWAHEYLADALEGAGRKAEALKLWQRWQRSGPNNRLRVVADFYMRADKPALALDLYRKYLARQPGSAHAYNITANALWAMGKVKEADRVWAAGAKRSNADYTKKLTADYYRGTGRPAMAVPLYRAYLRGMPTAEGPREALAEALVAVGRPKEAEAALLSAAPAMAPRFRLGTVGLFFGRTGRLAKAITLLKQYVAATPGEPRVYQLLAGAYLAAGKKSEAEAVWKGAMKRCPNCAAKAADFYQRVGRCKDAVPLYRKALAGDHQSISLRNQLAHCLEAMGKAAEAKKMLASSVALAGLAERLAPFGYWSYRGRNEAHSSALNSSAWLFLTHGSLKARHKHALTLARKAVRLSPLNKHLLGTLVVALCRNGQGAEALRISKRRMARNPLSPWAHLERAMAHLTLGQRDLARKHLQRSRKLHLVPDPDLVRLQREVAAGLKAATP